MVGTGFTVTTKSTEVPGHVGVPGPIGVTVYVTVSTAVPLFVSVSEMFPLPLPLNPVTFPDDPTAVQVNVVPVTSAVGTIAVVPKLQSSSVSGAFVITGIGLTVTFTIIGLPTQPAAVGVTVYVTT